MKTFIFKATSVPHLRLLKPFPQTHPCSLTSWTRSAFCALVYFAKSIQGFTNPPFMLLKTFTYHRQLNLHASPNNWLATCMSDDLDRSNLLVWIAKHDHALSPSTITWLATRHALPRASSGFLTFQANHSSAYLKLQMVLIGLQSCLMLTIIVFPHTFNWKRIILPFFGFWGMTCLLWGTRMKIVTNLLLNNGSISLSIGRA